MDIKVKEATAPHMAEPTQRTEIPQTEEFRFTLDKFSKEGIDDRLKKLYTDITVQGKKLGDHLDISDLKKYRSMIKDFVNQVVTTSHKFTRENILDRRGRHRVYGIVKVVDQNLDDLAKELMKTEKDHLKILGKVDEIRGLLLDIIT